MRRATPAISALTPILGSQSCHPTYCHVETSPIISKLKELEAALSRNKSIIYHVQNNSNLVPRADSYRYSKILQPSLEKPEKVNSIRRE